MRVTSLLIAAFGFIALIAFVYAFVQQEEAKRQATLVIACERESIEMRQQLETINRKVQQEADRAEAALRFAEELKVKAESESKKK